MDVLLAAQLAEKTVGMSADHWVGPSAMHLAVHSANRWVDWRAVLKEFQMVWTMADLSAESLEGLSVDHWVVHLVNCLVDH